MGKLTLPDVRPDWDIYGVETMGSKDQEMRHTWLADVIAKREELLARVASRKESKLRGLVYQMLSDRLAGRIDACSLAEATKECRS